MVGGLLSNLRQGQQPQPQQQQQPQRLQQPQPQQQIMQQSAINNNPSLIGGVGMNSRAGVGGAVIGGNDNNNNNNNPALLSSVVASGGGGGVRNINNTNNSIHRPPPPPPTDELHTLVLQLFDRDQRESALLELSKRRESFPDLAPILWHTVGVVAVLLQEIASIYPSLAPPTLTANASNRVCNALALLQCVASHPDTRSLFLGAHIPLYLYPFLNTQYLR